MEESKKQSVPFTEKLFGGIKMSWVKVVIFTVAAALFTASMLVIPVTEGTSFREIGVGVECWVLFAVIIMTNCEKPLESALKTFVFFLISQPLIYLFQVPFSDLGFGLFMYYKWWFIVTLFTFPAAFVGWYIKKKNWLSLLILSPVIVLLAYTGTLFMRETYSHFPFYLVSTLVCFGQIFIYLYAFFDDKIRQIIGLILAVGAVIVVFAVVPKIDATIVIALPDTPVLSESAHAFVEDKKLCGVEVFNVENETFLRTRFVNYGSTVLHVTDNSESYTYSLSLEEDEQAPSIKLERTDK